MLVLSRKVDQVVVIGGNVRVMVVEVRGDKVRLGIDAPRDVPVHREEVYEAIHRTAPDLVADTPPDLVADTPEPGGAGADPAAPVR